jgi:HSP20 family protein
MEDKMSRWMGWGADSGITISEDTQNVYVEVHLPGLKASDLDISFHQNTLWVKGEKKEEEIAKDRKFYKRAKSSYFYQVDLPTEVEENTEEASYKDGVLLVTFKKSCRSPTRKISVNHHGDDQETKIKTS